MKEKLTLDYCIENKFNPRQCVKHYFPDYDDKLCDYVLWNETCFPFEMEETLNELHQLYLKAEQHVPPGN